MRKVYIDSVDLTNYLGGKGFVVNSMQGLEAPSINTTVIPKSGLDGVIVPTSYARERRITINGVLAGTCFPEVVEARRELASVVAPVRTDFNAVVPKVLRMEDFDGSLYEVKVVVNALDFARQNMFGGAWQLDLIATDWRIFSGGNENAIAITQGEYGHFSIPFSIPFSFIGGSGSQTLIENRGNAPAPFRWTLTGQATNPALVNNTTGQYIQLNMVVGLGDVIEVRMEDKIVTVNGNNALSSVATGSSFWELAPGDNMVSLVTATTAEQPVATIYWRDTYGGV